MIRWNSVSGSTTHTTNGYRILRFSTSSDGASMNRFCESRIKAYSNNKNEMIVQQVSMIWNNTTNNQEMRLFAYHNAGLSLNYTYSGFQAIRIK